MGELVTFYRVLPGRPPRRALKSGAGTMPARAFQYCEPSRLASGFGWYVFLPMTFQVEWDGGREAIWSFDDGCNWYPLSSAAYPDSMAAWDAVAPDACKGYCPAFVSTMDDAGVLQIWTGWFARTAPGYSLLVRAPANVTPSAGYHTLEGIVDTDQWFGPLFTNVRLTRSGAPVRFDADFPFLQVQPLPRDCYGDQHLDNVTVEECIPGSLWPHYEHSLIQRHGRAHYATEARRRRAADNAR